MLSSFVFLMPPSWCLSWRSCSKSPTPVRVLLTGTNRRTHTAGSEIFPRDECVFQSRKLSACTCPRFMSASLDLQQYALWWSYPGNQRVDQIPLPSLSHEHGDAESSCSHPKAVKARLRTMLRSMLELEKGWVVPFARHSVCICSRLQDSTAWYQICQWLSVNA